MFGGDAVVLLDSPAQQSASSGSSSIVCSEIVSSSGHELNAKIRFCGLTSLQEAGTRATLCMTAVKVSAVSELESWIDCLRVCVLPLADSEISLASFTETFIVVLSLAVDIAILQPCFEQRSIGLWSTGRIGVSRRICACGPLLGSYRVNEFARPVRTLQHTVCVRQVRRSTLLRRASSCLRCLRFSNIDILLFEGRFELRGAAVMSSSPL